jgi:hypothetical protein
MVMDMQKFEALPPPPGVIASLQAGFNVVSSHVVLITLPVLLNAFLWLGPRVSVGQWYGAIFENWINFLKRNGLPAQDLAVYTENAPLFVDFMEKLNWLGWVRTLPIGIPALLLDLPNNLECKV